MRTSFTSAAKRVSASHTMTNVVSTDFLCVTISNLQAASMVQWKYFSADVLTQKLLHLHHTGASVPELNSALLCDCLKHKPAAREGAQRDFCKHSLPQGRTDCSLQPALSNRQLSCNYFSKPFWVKSCWEIKMRLDSWFQRVLLELLSQESYTNGLR